jgi:hypothetical protein
VLAVHALLAALVLALLGPLSGCREAHELFPEHDAGNIEPPTSSPASSSLFHLISIGANAQTDGTGFVNGFGAAIVLRDEQVLFWGNGGEQTDGRGIVVAVVDPESGEPSGDVASFDTWETRFTGGTETARLVAFLEAIEPGMLVLLVVGDDAGVTDNGTPEVLCNQLEDADTLRLFELLEALGSQRIRDYCYRASWAMAAFQGKGTAEQEVLIDGAPAHVTVRLP